MKLKENIKFIVEKELNKMGFDLYDFDLRKQKNSWQIRVFADKSEGITIEDCEAISRKLEENFERSEELAYREYALEVSSPGLDRKLYREKDFKWAMGKKVSIKMKKSPNGKTKYKGKVLEVNETEVTIDISGKQKRLSLDNIKDARLEININYGS